MIAGHICRRIGVGQSASRVLRTGSSRFHVATNKSEHDISISCNALRNTSRTFCVNTKSASSSSGSSQGEKIEGNCTKQLTGLKLLVKQYGKVAIITHVIISTGLLTGVYVALDRGVDVSEIVRQTCGDTLADSTAKIMGSSLGTFGVAFGIYKCLAPIRWPITIFTVPLIAKGLKRIRL